MRIPDTLASLADYGIIDEVLRPLMSGKEAQIYLVLSDGEYRVAKVFKEAQNRTFKNRAEYTEGRKVRNSRDQRAMGKNTRHGKAQIEAAWRTTEVDMIYRLRAAGVRVPVPYHFIDGVLVMEMISDERGDPAPRLGDVVLEPEGAQLVFDRLLAEVVRMLAAGVVHGDLSDFNVLMAPDGPVVIDFPQAVDASSNQNARKLLLRDVDNLHRFMARFVPERAAPPYAQEMWALYERGELTPDTKLTGRYKPAEHKISTESVLGLIGDATRDERKRREHLGLSMRGAADTEGAVPEERVESAPRELSRYAQKRQAQVAATAAAKAEAERLAKERAALPPQARSREPSQAHSREPSQAHSREAGHTRTREGNQPHGRDAHQARSRDGQARSRDGGQQRPRDVNPTHARDGGQQRPREAQPGHARDGGQQRPRDGHQTQVRDGGQQRPREAPHTHARDAGQQRPREAPHTHARDAGQQRPRDSNQGPARDAGQQRSRSEQRPREHSQDSAGRAPSAHERSDAGAARRAPHPQAAHAPQQPNGPEGSASEAQIRRRRRRRRKPGANAQTVPTRD